jgi:carboxyl-terminal processing protease
MKKIKLLSIALVAAMSFASCFEDNDDNIVSANEINDFVWKGMNVFYLYKDNIPNLANDRFSSNQEYASYLNDYDRPEQLFESLIYQRPSVDKYSWIVDDYIALEQLFSGVSTSNGMEYRLFIQPNSSTQMIGIVRLVLPGSDADIKGVKRGDIFSTVNGIPLTTSNVNELLSLSTYTINKATYDDNGTPEATDDSIIPGNESITLNKLEYSENPIYENDIFNVAGSNVGYLMYNGFTSNYDTELNDVFANFKSSNVQDLILDLRYNPGGSVNTAILLSSMITGQFNGEVFSTEQWNSEFQEAYNNSDPELLINRFTDNDDGAPLNTLNLNRVYVIATGASASASELVINSLDPYIDVIHIGDFTSGKYQASTTLYDSNNFGRNGANPNHTYALQPLIFKSVNNVGRTDYDNGLTPDIELKESYLNLGVIGDVNEKLLAAAISEIENSGKWVDLKAESKPELKKVLDSNDMIPFGNDMYVEKEIPTNLINRKTFK